MVKSTYPLQFLQLDSKCYIICTHCTIIYNNWSTISYHLHCLTFSTKLTFCICDSQVAAVAFFILHRAHAYWALKPIKNKNENHFLTQFWICFQNHFPPTLCITDLLSIFFLHFRDISVPSFHFQVLSLEMPKSHFVFLLPAYKACDKCLILCKFTLIAKKATT